jgi:hypothetical protein
VNGAVCTAGAERRLTLCAFGGQFLHPVQGQTGRAFNHTAAYVEEIGLALDERLTSNG